MDNELLYGDPESDPITNPNVFDKVNNKEEVSLAEIYSNATLITSELIFGVIKSSDVKSAVSRVFPIRGF